MRKTLICLSLAAAGILMQDAAAQVVDRYDGLQLNKMSDNGLFIAASSSSSVTIINRETGKVYNYTNGYQLGGGNSLCDAGVAVGSGEYYMKCVVWKDGTWSELPHDFTRISYSRADAVSSDGSVIVGTMDVRACTGKPYPMYQPVVWELDETSGSYSKAVLLPVPEKDITGCAPQQILANGISADGNTIVGQVVDYMGLLQYQIVYTRSENGWIMTTSGSSLLEKPGSEWPPYPKRPVKPNEEDYLTPEEIAAYNNAMKLYQDSLEIASLTGINPKRPVLTNFIVAKREAYDAAMSTYEHEANDYNMDLTAFRDAYLKNLTGGTFGYNSPVISSNGIYYASNYAYPDPTFVGDLKDAPSYNSPMVFETANPDSGRLFLNKSMSVFSVTNNGNVVAATPANDENVWARTAYMIDSDNNATQLSEWLSKESPEAYELLKAKMSFDIAADKNDGVAVSDTLFVGSVRMSGDARRWIGYAVEPATRRWISYYLDLDAKPESAIESVADEAAKLGCVYDRRSATLTVTGGVAAVVELYDLNGRLLLSHAGNPATVDLGRLNLTGIAIVKLTGADGSVAVSKVAL